MVDGDKMFYSAIYRFNKQMIKYKNQMIDVDIMHI